MNFLKKNETGEFEFAKQREKVNLLLVEDNPGDADLIRAWLEEAKDLEFRITHVKRFSDATERASNSKVDLILLDLGLPDIQGLESVKWFRLLTPNIPVIVLTGLADEEKALQALRLGAQDYLTKGLGDQRTVLKSIRYALERFKSQKQLQKLNREVEEANRRLERLAFHDPLTNLLNRRGVEDFLRDKLKNAAVKGTGVAGVIIDCDDFKSINDNFGHSVGDKTLSVAAKRIKANVRENDAAARIGGDEFFVVLSSLPKEKELLIKEAKALAERIRKSICENGIVVNGQQVDLTVSSGIAPLDPDEISSLDAAIRKTQFALKKSKCKGKNAVSTDDET